MKLAQRLLLGTAIVIGVLVVLITALGGARMSRELEGWQEDDLLREARFVASERSGFA
jgi:hypothetical protein